MRGNPDWDPTNPNSGHGHVHPRPDGTKYRCGGPRICTKCGIEADAKTRDDAKARDTAIADALNGPVLPPHQDPPLRGDIRRYVIIDADGEPQGEYGNPSDALHQLKGLGVKVITLHYQYIGQDVLGDAGRFGNRCRAPDDIRGCDVPSHHRQPVGGRIKWPALCMHPYWSLCPSWPSHPFGTVIDMATQTRTERQLAALSLTLLDHLDTCPVCRDDGVRWCQDFHALELSLRHERLRALGVA